MEQEIDGSYIIFFLLFALFLIIYLSLYYSKSLTDKYNKIKENLVNWFYSLYISKDGKKIISKGTI